MTKPEDIPQDVWDAANKAMVTAFTLGDATIHLARAILAERERCAALCDASKTQHMFDAGFLKDADGGWRLTKIEDRDAYDTHVCRSNEALALAAAIRKGAQ